MRLLMSEREESAKILGDLDSSLTATDLAGKMSYSRPQFDRIARKKLGEPPMGLRRRLLLERAAYQLTRTKTPVTELAFDACYESLEGFSRAFRTAFGVSPREFRELGAQEHRIDLNERLHYTHVSTPHSKGTRQMNTTQLLTEHHFQEMNRFLDLCEQLPESALDETLPNYETYPWMEPSHTLRQSLARASAFAAPWMEAINGEKTNYEPLTIPEMYEANRTNRDGFLSIIQSVERDQSYDVTFVDSGCEPPQVFSYVGVIVHSLTTAAYRRLAISEALRRHGVADFRVTDPIDTYAVFRNSHGT
jgi:AraC-like DNA-binding protein